MWLKTNLKKSQRTKLYLFQLILFLVFFALVPPFSFLHHSFASPSVSFISPFSSPPAQPVHFNLPAASPLRSVCAAVCIKYTSSVSFVEPLKILLLPVSLRRRVTSWSWQKTTSDFVLHSYFTEMCYFRKELSEAEPQRPSVPSSETSHQQNLES